MGHYNIIRATVAIFCVYIFISNKSHRTNFEYVFRYINVGVKKKSYGHRKDSNSYSWEKGRLDSPIIFVMEFLSAL